MQTAHDRACRAGIVRMSLSVDAENAARRLYERIGYLNYAPDDGLGRMLVELA